MVLASVESLRDWFDAPDDLEGIDHVRDEIGDTPPEDIDDGRDTAPSKRLLKHIPGYQKRVHGPVAIEDAGLPSIRDRCPRFDAWIESLERLGSAG